MTIFELCQYCIGVSDTTTALTYLGILHCGVTVLTVKLHVLPLCALCSYVYCTCDRTVVSADQQYLSPCSDGERHARVLVDYFHKVPVILYHNHRHERHQLPRLVPVCSHMNSNSSYYCSECASGHSSSHSL